MQKLVPGASAEPLELGEFVRGLAHDIANPLNSLAMNAELAKVLFDRGDATAMRDTLERLLADCARCGQLVQNFQGFGAALRASPPEAVDVATLVQSSIELTQSEVLTGAVEFHVEGAKHASLHADREAMERALAAILRNAVEAGATTIGVRIEAARGRVRLQVTDNGCGIEARWLERVTEPFFSTRRAQGGIGLGLSLACEILRRHGGTLDIQSQAGSTVVRIELPTATDA